jgi:hypothetical protein
MFKNYSLENAKLVNLIGKKRFKALKKHLENWERGLIHSPAKRVSIKAS